MKTGCQIYVKGSVEAAAFYREALNLTLGMNFMADDGTYAHASLMSGEREILAIAESNGTHSHSIQDNKCPVMTFNCYELGSKGAVIHAYNVLSQRALNNYNPDGPTSVPWSELCFSLVDKFGVHWWIAV